MVDSLTENIRKETPWQMMFADDVMLFAREKDVLELELEQWREALEKRGMKVSRAKTECMCLNGTPLGSVKMQSAQLHTGHQIQISGKHPAERWLHEYRNKQEESVWVD